MPATGALNDMVTALVTGSCEIVEVTEPQLELNTLGPLAMLNKPLKLPVVIVSVIVKALAPAGAVTDTQ